MSNRFPVPHHPQKTRRRFSTVQFAVRPHLLLLHIWYLLLPLLAPHARRVPPFHLYASLNQEGTKRKYLHLPFQETVKTPSNRFRSRESLRLGPSEHRRSPHLLPRIMCILTTPSLSVPSVTTK